MRIHLTALFCSAALVACVADDSDTSTIDQTGKKPTTITTPVLSQAGATASTIKIRVCAPADGTGLPAGFSLQWMTKAQNDATGWPASTEVCKISMSGNANGSTYNLAAGQCIDVAIGDFFDNDPQGFSFSCSEDLQCGTDYVFRAFGHATSSLARSPFTANFVASTLACEPGETCTYTQGYWKNHNPLVCLSNPDSPLCIEWPVTSLFLGTVEYTVEQLISIFNTPAAGNGLISLAHQLEAAKLNVAANGATPPQSVIDAIDAADALIVNRVAPPIGSGYLAPKDTSSLTDALTQFNEGAVAGWPHCE